MEYKTKPEQFCTQANAMNFNSLFKKIDLDAYRVACREASTTVTPTPSVVAVVNAASFRGGSVAPGELVAAFGTDLGPAEPVGCR